MVEPRLCCILTILILVAKASAEKYDCSKEPDFEFSEDDDCCEMSPLTEKGSYDKCMEETTTKYPKAKDLLKDCYVEECMFRIHGGNDTKLLVEEGKKYLINKLSSLPDWHPVVEKILERCMGPGSMKADVHIKKMGDAPYNLKGCNPIYSYYTSCITVGLITECPAKYYSKSTACDHIKGFLKACPHQYPPENYQEH